MPLPRDFGSVPVFSSESAQQKDGQTNLLYPISLDELNKCFPRNSSAPGQDFSTVSDLKQISRFELLNFFNIFLFCRKVPVRFCRARTIFIPKKPAEIDPGDFRPISLTPIPVRLFSNFGKKTLLL
ncbi:hypothetical protein AVEN_106353-1 [Araneus ventricosus]|uniref:Uncharacterized protein n=1 Tax=Araneus ventricosus TaxID=182803 RepID=A0A4Y2ATJ0_ARAVE|nr:hypothetical protein AVEN_106353-1 [Araneus ventricosus]